MDDFSDRESMLGFRPQKESIYSRLLPYADALDEESNVVLSEIKENLARSVQLRDIKLGTSHWAVQLSKYIRIYGYKFTKEDHLNFVHLMYQLTTTPKMEYSLVQKFGGTLTVLLKKDELLSREDLILPWRPLYDLMEETVYSSLEQHGLQLLPSNIDNSVKAIIRSCRTYFSDESTKEMLEEWRPLLCPYDVTVIRGLSYYELFLPTTLPPEKHHIGFKLWFQETLDLWCSFRTCPSWEMSLVNLFSRLAEDNIGYVDWSPHMPMIFTRILRSFNLPVGNKQTNYSRGNNCYEVNTVAAWMVSMLGEDDTVLQQLQTLLGALHSFVHPSNSGRWSLKLASFLQSVPYNMVKRMHRERYMKPNWKNKVPESHKLRNSDITKFVEIMKPEVYTAMFGKWVSQDASIRNLAALRAEIIMPPLLEKMYPAMETLIEPHRLIACMYCLTSAARPMLSARTYYPEGPSHVLPLLHLALPGVDPNDFKKTLVTLQLISTFAALVPIVDCSAAPQLRSDLTDDERELCSATAQFEDFVLEFLNRFILMIENNSQEAQSGAVDRLTAEQSLLEVGLASTVTSVLQQCSKPIFMSALHKINRFISEGVFETRVSGRLAANLCRACSRVNPEETLKLMLPPLCQKICSFAEEHPGFPTEEHLCNSFLWHILTFSQMIRCNGVCLLPYRDMLMETLGHILRVQSQQGVELSGQALRFLLRALCLTYPLEFRSVTQDLDQPLTDYFPIRDWAVPGDIRNLNLRWYIPTEATVEFATAIVRTFLTPQLDYINSLTSFTDVSKEDLHRRLHIILECLMGAGALLPAWEGEPVHLKDSQVSLNRFCCLTMLEKQEICFADGSNVRAAVADSMRDLLKYLQESREDDTQNMFKVIQIYDTVMMFFGILKGDVDARTKSFQVVKSALQNHLNIKKKHIRPVLVDRVTLLHETRSLSSASRVVTQRHMDLFNDLLKLCVGRYREVRRRAQHTLHGCFTYFHYTYHLFITPMVAYLKDTEIEEHAFKGVLHLILGSNNKRTFAIRRNWETLCELWPAIAQAQRFEKPSILRIIDDIITKVAKSQETIAISIPVSEECLQISEKILTCGSFPRVKTMMPSVEELTHAEQLDKNSSEENLRLYHKVVDELVSLVDGGTLTWKFSQNAMEFLALLLRDDVAIPTPVVQLFVKHCVSELIYIRKLSLQSLSTILKQQKRKRKKVLVNICLVASAPPSLPMDLLSPGDRCDNSWHQYHSNSLPTTREQWEACTFVPKTHLGYYCWPKELLKYDIATNQPKFVRTTEELMDNERPVAERFGNPQYVEKLLDFLALEETKGQDKFQLKHLTLFKGLFRNFGDQFLEIFKPHLERLVRDTSHDKHDSSQRCAMEVLSGLVRGSKHWPFDKIQNLWEWLLPLLSFIRNNITIETQDDWGTFFSTLSESRDPRQMHWLFELMLKNPISGDAGAFGDASRLLMLQQGLVQQEWRVPEMLHRLLVDVIPHLDHPYKAVRDRLGSVLSNIFLYDYQINDRSQTRSPQRGDFLRQILPQLDPLKNIQLDNGDNGACVNNVFGSNVDLPAASSDGTRAAGDETMAVVAEETVREDEQKRIIRLCKTVMKWLNHACLRSFSSLTADILPLLPVICNLTSAMNDEDLRLDCSITLTNLSTSQLSPEILPVALNTIKEVAGLQSWHARVAVLHFIQVSVFGNFFLLLNPECKLAIRELLLHLLCDERLEVRELAAMTLSGAMHCGFLEMNSEMLSHFEHLRRVKLKKSQNMEPGSLEKLIKRHAGVLGLSACVQAYPYDVPDFIPQILVDLSIHVNDPQPIQMTVKKTLTDFRRTHHDNWHDHKQMFTDDQLVVLTDLLISPNYYA